MNIRDALSVLVEIHTADDSQLGFAVRMGATPEPHHLRHDGEYIEAWGVVRDHLRHGDGTCNVCGEPLRLGCCNPNSQGVHYALDTPVEPKE